MIDRRSSGRDWLHASPDGRRFTLRAAQSLEELELCIGLQQRTWGYSDLEVVPRNIYVLAQALGGHVLCAWEDEREFAGFAMAVAAHEPDRGAAAAASWMQPVGSSCENLPSQHMAPPPVPYLHSHLVAVAAGAQSCGLGFALKFAQRDLALASGSRTMRWTFDPLMAGNAAFNLSKLGAVVRQHIPDFYGRLGSVLQGGTPTDRLLAEWNLESDRILAAREGRLAPASDPVARIELSAEIAAWKQAGALDRLEQAQQQLRKQFTEAFAAGLIVSGFVRNGAACGAYLLERPGAIEGTAGAPKSGSQVLERGPNED
jgi:predicted GNAT superfamily acetyltransferase